MGHAPPEKPWWFVNSYDWEITQDGAEKCTCSLLQVRFPFWLSLNDMVEMIPWYVLPHCRSMSLLNIYVPYLCGGSTELNHQVASKNQCVVPNGVFFRKWIHAGTLATLTMDQGANVSKNQSAPGHPEGFTQVPEASLGIYRRLSFASFCSSWQSAEVLWQIALGVSMFVGLCWFISFETVAAIKVWIAPPPAWWPCQHSGLNTWPVTTHCGCCVQHHKPIFFKDGRTFSLNKEALGVIKGNPTLKSLCL